MKTLVQSMLLTGALALGASGLTDARSNNNGMEQRFKAKYGRPSAMEEARLKADLADRAFRQEPSQRSVAANWTEQYFMAKFGRNTPAEEARLKAERESTAYREAPAAERAPALSLRDEQYRAKYGRLPGR